MAAEAAALLPVPRPDMVCSHSEHMEDRQRCDQDALASGRQELASWDSGCGCGCGSGSHADSDSVSDAEPGWAKALVVVVVDWQRSEVH
jgi:hypothetical protein